MSGAAELNERELALYVRRVADRWPIARAVFGGPRVDRSAEAGVAGEPYVVVLVSELFDGVPWLERVRQAGALWDAREMGGAADVHCYTRLEFERKREQLPSVRDALSAGVEIAPDAGA